MLYEFNGFTVPIPDEVYFKLDDIQLRDYLASARGFTTENPFFDSILEDGAMSLVIEDFELPEDIEEITEDIIEDEE